MNHQTSSQRVTATGMELHRCFYAIRLAPEANAYLAEMIGQLSRHPTHVRWVPERNIHITLRFLGEITAGQLRMAGEIDIPTDAFHGFSLRASGLGAFPMLRAPKVFWAGVAGETGQDSDRLLHVQERTERHARGMGLQPEGRRYRPHITLGRISRPLDGLRELVDDIIGRECLSPYSHVGEMVLMRSTLSGAGSAYEVLRSWRLG
ncbi:MAG: RNA 2',3'-cyclic phosphodiesterase [Bacteroidota bacterium]